MNSQGYAVQFFALVMTFVSSMLLIISANVNSVSAQDVERSLDIERYKNEPYEIVDVYVDGKSTKDKIKSKIKYGQEGLDNAKLKNKNGWYNYIKIRVRNTSSNQIISIAGSLMLEHPALPASFGLPITTSRDLNQEPLKPGEEIDLQAEEKFINKTKDFFLKNGANENVPVVRVIIDNVLFTKTYLWRKGGYRRIDPNNPDKWITIETPSPPEIRQNSKYSNPASSIFKPASYSRLVYDDYTCKQYTNDDYSSFEDCPNGAYECRRVEYVSSFTTPGAYTRRNYIAYCINPVTGYPTDCTDIVIHKFYVFDSDCPDPCPDNDNDGYTICQNDCNDNNANINPGMPENCTAQGDEDCDGGANELDRDCVECDEDDDGFEHMSPPCNGSDCDDEDPYFPLYLAAYCGAYQLGNPDYQNCSCEYESPIILDIAGNGFLLTSAANGVRFDLDSNGQKEQLGWTRVQSDDAWLVLDRNNNNLIDNGQELFGDFTPQPPPPPGEQLNGFLALAEYDKSASGGNHNGVIDTNDTIFSQLQLWQDINHNGISESNELHKLSELGLAELELEYKESKRTDEFGNQFRYRAKVKDVRGSRISRWAWDVFLVKGSSTSRTVNPKNNKFKGLIAQWETLSKPVQPFNFLISELVYAKPVGGCRRNSLVKAIY
jgi:hypothetical protein